MNLSQERKLVECIINVGQARKRIRSLPAEEAAYLKLGIDQFDRAMRQFYGQEFGHLDTWQEKYERIFEEIVKDLKTGDEGWKGSLELKWTIKIHALKEIQIDLPQITTSQVKYYVMRLLIMVKDRLHVCLNGNCQTLFLGRPNQRFCTRTCRTNTNVKKHRYKMKYQRNYSEYLRH